MNFFEHQDIARRNSGRLVLLFIGAVILIVAAVYLTAIVAIRETNAIPIEPDPERPWPYFFNPFVFVPAVGATLLLIGGATLYKIWELREGGSVVARSLGGRLLTEDTRDPTERRILNVVEEMAIASGVSCPPVYYLEQETGINAFAAGFSPDSAVIGVTRGCAERLTRDELQGVMAHEFSHILNGDMRLNIKLMGLLNGILVIGLIGYAALRLAINGAFSNRRTPFAPRQRRRRVRLDHRHPLRRRGAGGHWLHRHTDGQLDQSRRLTSAGVPRGRLRRPVHTQPGRHRGCPQAHPCNPKWGESTIAERSVREPHVLRTGCFVRIACRLRHPPTPGTTNRPHRTWMGWDG